MEDKIETICTVCLVELSPCVRVQEHPRLGVAVCNECLSVVRDDDGEEDFTEVCIWCCDTSEEAAELVQCDGVGCDQAWCRNCLETHIGSEYAHQVFNDTESTWHCCKCSGSSQLDALRAKHEKAVEAHLAMWNRGAKEFLIAVESEIAQAQEELEDEWLEAKREEIKSEVYAQGGDDSMLDTEMKNLELLIRRKLDLLLYEQPEAQERAEAEGIDLATFYMREIEARQEEYCETEAWRRAASLKSRKRGRLAQLCQSDDEISIYSNDSSCASYDIPKDAEAKRAKEDAERDLSRKAPIRKKRDKGGRITWVGASAGANGFEEKRIEELGKEIFDKIYEDTPAATTTALRDHYQLAREAATIDEIDTSWRTELPENDVIMIERREQELNGTRARVREKSNDKDIEDSKPRIRGPRSALRVPRSENLNSQLAPPSPFSDQAPASPIPESVTRGDTASRVLADDSSNKRNIEQTIDSATKKKLDFTSLSQPDEPEPPTKKVKPLSIIEARRIPNLANAQALLYLPRRYSEKRNKSQAHAEHMIRLPRGGSVSLGREATDLTGKKSHDDEGFIDFIDVCDSSNIKISRKLGQIECNDMNHLALTRHKLSKTAIYINGIALKQEEKRFFTQETSMLTLGKAPKKIEQPNHKKMHQQVHAYLLLPTANGDFSIPEYDPACFEVAVTELKARVRPTARPGDSLDSPIRLDDDMELIAGAQETTSIPMTAGPNSPPRSPNSFGLRKRKEVKEIEFDDDDVCAETREAQAQERAKRERLKQRKAKRALNEASGESSQAVLVDADSDDDVQMLTTESDQRRIRLNGDDENIEVRIPTYLTEYLKPHQVEAARFLYQQTIEDLDTLRDSVNADEDEAKTPYGCVLAHSMGLGKSLTCIAYLVALLKHSVAKHSLKTALVVAPANVIRNWQDEFEKWCKTDRRILDRVRVVDTKVNGKAAKVRELNQWRAQGGVCIIGYDLYAVLTSDSDGAARGPKKKSNDEAPTESLNDLWNRGALRPGGGVIGILGSVQYGDVLAGGVLVFAGATFKTPAKFAQAATGDGSDAWRRVTYKGQPLISLTRPGSSLIDDAAARRKAEENDLLCRQAREALQDPGPDLIVLDEAHTIKNPTCKKAKCLAQLRTRRRIALTGTPLQNNLMEYHTMITYVRGSILGTPKEFKTRFVDIINNGMCADSTDDDVKKSRRRTHVLKKKIQSFVLRRDQELLAQEVDKTEYLVVTKFNAVQRELYTRLLKDHLKTKNKLFAAFQPSIKIGNNPITFLFEKNADQNADAAFLPLPAITQAPDTIPLVSKRADAAIVPHETKKDDIDDVELLTDNVLLNGTEENDFATNFVKRKKKHGSDDEDDDDDDDCIDLISDESDDVEDENQDASSDEVIIVNPPSQPEVVVIDTEEAKEAQRGEEEAVEIESNSDEPEMKFGIRGEVLTSLKEGPLQTTDITKIDVATAVELSAKTAILFEIVAKCLHVGDKVVIFSQSLPTLSFLEHVLQSKAWVENRQSIGNVAAPASDTRPWKAGIDYLRIDGSVSGAERQCMVNAFEHEESSAKLFLLSVKAGNMGITLVQANRVILFDTSWNPAVDRQALFRCFRYGQKKHVFVYRLVAQGYEEKIHRRATQKEVLSLRVVDDTACERIYTAEDLVGVASLEDEDDDDNEGQEIVDPILFDILERGKNGVHRYCVTDTLFRENDDERLPENEEAEAEDEYQREQAGHPTRVQEQALLQAIPPILQAEAIRSVVQPSFQQIAPRPIHNLAAQAFQPVVQPTAANTHLDFGLPMYWNEAICGRTGRRYYYNKRTHKVSWKRPVDVFG